MRHHAKCCADRSNRCSDIVIFKLFAVTIDPVTVKIANWILIRQPEQ